MLKSGYEKSLKTSKGKPEAVNRRRTENTINKRNRIKRQTYKTPKDYTKSVRLSNTNLIKLEMKSSVPEG